MIIRLIKIFVLIGREHLGFYGCPKETAAGGKGKIQQEKKRDFLLETFQRMTDNLKYNDETAEQCDDELNKFETSRFEPEDIQR